MPGSVRSSVLLLPFALAQVACGGDDTTEDTAWPALVINEFMPGNAQTLQDEGGAYPDWIELYNPTDQEVDLADWTVSDDLEDPQKHVLTGISIDAGGWLLLYADSDTHEGPAHLGFNLASAGEEIGLYNPDGVAVDELEYGRLLDDWAAARIGDASSEWEITDTPSPGSSNPSSR